jgi:hypothetical protein
MGPKSATLGLLTVGSIHDAAIGGAGQFGIWEDGPLGEGFAQKIRLIGRSSRNQAIAPIGQGKQTHASQ